MGILGSALAAQKKQKPAFGHSITTHFNWHLVVNVEIYTRTPGYLSIYTHNMSRRIIFPFYFIFYCTKFPFFYIKFYFTNFTWLKCFLKIGIAQRSSLSIDNLWPFSLPLPVFYFLKKKDPKWLKHFQHQVRWKRETKGRRKSL